MNTPNRYRWLSFATPLALIGMWELAVQLGWLNRIFYPPPSEVVVTFGRMVADGSLWHDVSVSLWRVTLGMLFGAIPAIVVGLLMGISPAVRAAIPAAGGRDLPDPKDRAAAAGDRAARDRRGQQGRDDRDQRVLPSGPERRRQR